MAGGNFDLMTGKVRPGTYINFTGTSTDELGTGSGGVVLLPLFAHNYGPKREYIKIENSDPESAMTKLGYSVFDKSSPAMLLIREAFKNAKSLVLYIPEAAMNEDGGSKRASASVGSLSVSAKYTGSRGNAFKVAVEKIAGSEKFNVSVFLDTLLVEKKSAVETVEDLGDSEWVDFDGTGALSATSGGTAFSGGKDALFVRSDVEEFVNGCGTQVWDTMAFALSDDGSSDFSAVLSAKIKTLREGEGKYRKAVMPNCAVDYEGIINVTNGVKLADGTIIDAEKAVAWVAGADAAAAYNQSLTYKAYQGAVEVLGAKSHEEAVRAIEAGEFFFSLCDDGSVVVEYDINSLVSLDKTNSKYYKKNRVIRTLDSLGNMIKNAFPPNKYSNNPLGWDVMEGMGRKILKQFEDDGAIMNVDYEKDFKVDRIASKGDSTYFDVGVQTADSAEKLYFSIKTV